MRHSGFFSTASQEAWDNSVMKYNPNDAVITKQIVRDIKFSGPTPTKPRSVNRSPVCRKAFKEHLIVERPPKVEKSYQHFTAMSKTRDDPPFQTSLADFNPSNQIRVSDWSKLSHRNPNVFQPNPFLNKDNNPQKVRPVTTLTSYDIQESQSVRAPNFSSQLNPRKNCQSGLDQLRDERSYERAVKFSLKQKPVRVPDFAKTQSRDKSPFWVSQEEPETTSKLPAFAKHEKPNMTLRQHKE